MRGWAPAAAMWCSRPRPVTWCRRYQRRGGLLLSATFDRCVRTAQRQLVRRAGQRQEPEARALVRWRGHHLPVELASNLVSGDTNGKLDVFVRDRNNHNRPAESASRRAGARPMATAPTRRSAQTAATSSSRRWRAILPLRPQHPLRHFPPRPEDRPTEHVSVSTGGGRGQRQQPLSGDLGRRPLRRLPVQREQSRVGRHQPRNDVFVRDMPTGRPSASASLERHTGNRDSGYPDLSDDGRYVIFISRARNLSSGDTNSFNDLFVHDRATAPRPG